MPVQQQLIQQAYVYALDPTPAQARAFRSHAGGARYAYNWGVGRITEALDAYAAEKEAGVARPTTKIPGHFDLGKAWTAWKNTAEWTDRDTGQTTVGVPWVGGNFSGTYQAALRDAAGAWSKFFDSRSGRRSGRKMGRPRYKSRHRSKQAFQVHGTGLQVTDAKHIRIPVIGSVHTHESTRKIGRLARKADTVCPGCRGTAVTAAATGGTKKCPDCKGRGQVPVVRIVRGTVSQDSSGRWSIALTVERIREIRTSPSARQRAGGAIGVDWGVRDLAVLSTGQVISNARPLEAALPRMARAQKALARCDKGSRRRQKAQRQVGKLHARIRSIREDAISKAVSELIHGHAAIAVEGWDVQQTAQHGSTGLPARVRHDRNRALADTGIGAARWKLQARAAWYGATVVVAGKHVPTGRTCSACGTARAKPLPPTQEEFMCPGCGYRVDRRINTARVLAALHQNDAPSGGESKNARGATVRPSGPRAQTARGTEASSPHPVLAARAQTGTPGPQGPGVLTVPPQGTERAWETPARGG